MIPPFYDAEIKLLAKSVEQGGQCGEFRDENMHRLDIAD